LASASPSVSDAAVRDAAERRGEEKEGRRDITPVGAVRGIGYSCCLPSGRLFDATAQDQTELPSAVSFQTGLVWCSNAWRTELCLSLACVMWAAI